ncbi:Hypothetical protein PHPALM_12419 [Phytophthora palmivora]|uniref:Uncharacterized protein n=1 Tax=Phytophthora palmivora TaxID=4796 RepID=A0A2P4XZR8_9STRA|nr:Hypothetical protein PHPALM_12419 [Phytophthora palmivora]
MGKSTERNLAAEKEFAALGQVLIQTANDAAQCLKVLKKNLSEYDSRHGNHFLGTAKSFMRSDIRNAKDISSDLKDVAHQIQKSHKPSKAEVASARNMMNATSQAMDVLKVTALNYDEKNNHGGGTFSNHDGVEALVKSTLRDNFNLNVLSYQIITTEKTLSPSLVERAKEAVHDVKDKLKRQPTTTTA